jgi:hypothetical protein
VSGTGSYSSGVTWSANIGSVNSSGNYTAPGSTGTATITACSSQSGYTGVCGSATVPVESPTCSSSGIDFDVATTWTTQPASGTLDSQTFDTGVASGAQLNSITWKGNLPSGASVGFQIAVSGDSDGPWNFIGPDGTSGTVYAGIAGTPIPLDNYSSLSGRYFRYRVILTTNATGSASPTVNDVIINWSP